MSRERMGVMFVLYVCVVLNISLLPKSINPVRIHVLVGDVVGTLKLKLFTQQEKK